MTIYDLGFTIELNYDLLLTIKYFFMGVLRLIKDLQAELMASTELPHVVSVRLLARLDEAERHLGFGSAQPPAEAPAIGEVAVEADKAVEGLEEVK
ncbi:MAG: hypothetical protein Q8K92_08350 [Leadbetterella sp.]|nr:hypothetical protein [Leadbetterella sp.]